jgi:hypothetical protein
MSPCVVVGEEKKGSRASSSSFSSYAGDESHLSPVKTLNHTTKLWFHFLLSLSLSLYKSISLSCN